MKKCPFCAEEIQDDAIKCKHCQSMLNGSSDKNALVSQLRPYSQWLLVGIFSLSIIAFFSPNFGINLPIVGKMNVSMFDVVVKISDISGSQSGSDITTNIKSNAANVIKNLLDPSLGSDKATISYIFVMSAILGIVLHYLLTIIWGICTFVLHKTCRILDIVWLALAVQFPILFSIGMKIISAELNSLISSSKDADNPFASLGASMMVNSFSIEPGIVMWMLMILSILGLVIQFMDKEMVAKSPVNSGITKEMAGKSFVNSGSIEIEGLESIQKKLRKRTIIAIAGIIILIVLALAALDSTTNFDSGPNANISNNKQVEAPTPNKDVNKINNYDYSKMLTMETPNRDVNKIKKFDSVKGKILLNGKYTLDEMIVAKLKNGEFKQGSQIVELEDFTLGDIDKDGAEDAAVILTENAGGSGWFYSLIAVINREGQFKQIGKSLSLGDRIILKSIIIKNGIIIVDMVTHGPEDGMCCPTMRKIVKYQLIGDNLENLK